MREGKALQGKAGREFKQLEARAALEAFPGFKGNIETLARSSLP
jgi:hypothetical protein